MKIVVSDDLSASALDALRAEAGWVVDARTGRSPEQLAADVADADALLVRSATRVDARLIAAAPALKVIARAGTGVDNVDVEAASRRGILVVNAPGANGVSVAEHALALMLALARSVPAADRAMKEGRWEKRRFLGTELRSKTVAILGFGRIGREVAQRARAFGMRVVAHDPFIPREIANAAGAELLTLDEACAVADFISLHLPSTPETRFLFDDARFARCRPGLRIVNTARGDLIDPAALGRAIDAGIVAGAGLDVFDVEPPKAWELANRPQVVATPHIAASTEEAQELVGIDVAESRSARPRDYTSLVSIRLQTDEGDRTVEGTVFEPGNLRLVSLNGVGVDAPLSGTLVMIENDDQPGVIGEVGSLLGRRGINIANFALGRGSGGAVAVVNVDDPHDGTLEEALRQILAVAAIRDAWIVRLQP